jgi:hypothetical protein
MGIDHQRRGNLLTLNKICCVKNLSYI